MNFEPNSLTQSQIREEEQIAEVEEGASDGEGPPEELTSHQIEAEVTAEATSAEVPILISPKKVSTANNNPLYEATDSQGNDEHAAEGLRQTRGAVAHGGEDGGEAALLQHRHR